MGINADTNVLIRAMTGDHAEQSALAKAELARADLVAVSLPALCEVVWVLRQAYRLKPEELAKGLRHLISTPNIAINAPAVGAGLAMLDRGGDFADGVIAFEGRWLGGETFVSFDRKAVERVRAQGQPARLPGK